MGCTEEQEHVVQSVLTPGRNVVAEAPPGTGKTFVILEACRRLSRRHPQCTQPFVQVLAYNTELAAQIVAKIKASAEPACATHVRCHTFHGLMTGLVRETRDDDDLERLVCDLEASIAVVPAGVVDAIEYLFVDELQDLNTLHLRTLHAVFGGKSRSSRTSHLQILAVGDAHQRLYNYGRLPSLPDAVARAEELLAIGAAAQLPWTRCRLTQSFRLTPQMATVVNAHFGTALVGMRDARRTSVVALEASRWTMGEEVVRLLRSEEKHTAVNDILLMTATKSGNVPLRRALNDISKAGIPLFVHGVDGKSSADLRRGKLFVSTFHSAKGVESRVTIVLVPERCDVNPLYVALTRAYERMYVLFCKPQGKYGRVPALARSLSEANTQLPREVARAVAANLVTAEATDEATVTAEVTPTPTPTLTPTLTPTPTAPRFVNCVARVDESHVTTETVLGDDDEATADDDALLNDEQVLVECPDGCMENVQEVYRLAVLCACEHKICGSIRAVEDVLHPCRVEFDRRETAMQMGFMARFVAPGTPQDALLPDAFQSLVHDVYHHPELSWQDFVTLAVCVRAWNGYHHQMRQLLPVDRWMPASTDDALQCACARAMAAVHRWRLTKFDVRVHAACDGRLLHARVDASGEDCVALFVLHHATRRDRVKEAVSRAVLHASATCVVVGLDASGASCVVRVTDVSAYRARCFSDE